MRAWQKRRATPARAHTRTPHYPPNEKKGQSLFLILARCAGFASDLGKKKGGPAPLPSWQRVRALGTRKRTVPLFLIVDG